MARVYHDDSSAGNPGNIAHRLCMGPLYHKVQWGVTATLISYRYLPWGMKKFWGPINMHIMAEDKLQIVLTFTFLILQRVVLHCESNICMAGKITCQ